MALPRSRSWLVEFSGRPGLAKLSTNSTASGSYWTAFEDGPEVVLLSRHQLLPLARTRLSFQESIRLPPYGDRNYESYLKYTPSFRNCLICSGPYYSFNFGWGISALLAASCFSRCRFRPRATVTSMIADCRRDSTDSRGSLKYFIAGWLARYASQSSHSMVSKLLFSLGSKIIQKISICLWLI